MGKFSHSLESNMLILLDDTKSKSEHTQTELKSVLSEESQYIERKGEMGEMRRTYARILLASNEKRPLNLDEDERRWFVPSPIRHRIDGDETQAFITDLVGWLESSGSMDALYNWFMTYDLTGFNPKRIQQTSTLREMIDSSTSVEYDLAISFAEAKQVFTPACLKEEFGSQANLIKKHILEAGWIGASRTDSKAKLLNGSQVKLIRPKSMTLKDAKHFFENGKLPPQQPTLIETENGLLLVDDQPPFG
jgi:hypothetical protein